MYNKFLTIIIIIMIKKAFTWFASALVFGEIYFFFTFIFLGVGGFTQFSLNRSFLQVSDLSSPVNTRTEVISWQIWFPGLSLCCHDRLWFRWIKNWVLCCFFFSLKLAYIDIKGVCPLQGKRKSVMCQKFIILLFFIFNTTNNCRK